MKRPRNLPKQRPRTAASAEKKPRWSQAVTRGSGAIDLKPGVFSFDDPRRLAQSLKASAEAGGRPKAPPFRSAMSVLTFYVNRAGGSLPDERRRYSIRPRRRCASCSAATDARAGVEGR